MSASDASVTTPADRTLAFVCYLPAPFELVRLTVDIWGEDCLQFQYRGPPSDLINAGVTSAAELKPGRRGVRRLDSEGYPVTIIRPARGQRFEVHRHRTFEQAATMPCFQPWMVDFAKARVDGLRAAENTRVQAAAAAHEFPRLAPAVWRGAQLGRLDSYIDAARRFGDFGRESPLLLDGKFRINAADAEAFRARLVRAQQDLAALLRSMRIERQGVSPGHLRLVVDNTAGERH